MTVTKAVIPAAGLGTRFLPATKSVPKEMLPVVDTPAIEYVVREAVAAGLHDVLMITGRSKRALEDHFDAAIEVEQALERKGDNTRLAAVRASTELAQIHYVRQGEAKGLGHAVSCAEAHVGDEPFAVLLGDDLIGAEEDLLKRMLATQQARGGSVVALMEVPADQIHLYGCAEVSDREGDVCRVTGLVEKPAADEAPSNLAIIGRYVLAPAVFDVLRKTAPGRGGEIQLTDALQTLAVGTGDGFGVHGVIFSGTRYDTGDRLDYLKAVVQLAVGREEFGADFAAWLKEYAQGL